MDIICPIVERDFDKFLLLNKTLNKFYHSDYRVFLVSKSGSSPIRDKRIVPIKERLVASCLNGKKFVSSGWWIQQIIKIMAHKFCDTEHILVLDADCLAVKKFKDNDFIRDDKILTNYEFHSTEQKYERSYVNWYNGSEVMLGLPRISHSKFHTVTPSILNRNILLGLESYLKTLYGPRYPEYLLRHCNLGNGNTWTEYTLYHIYAENCGLYNKYHINYQNFHMYGNCVWFESELENWNEEKSFINPSFYFSVLQSTSNYDTNWLYDKIKRYIS